MHTLITNSLAPSIVSEQYIADSSEGRCSFLSGVGYVREPMEEVRKQAKRQVV